MIGNHRAKRDSLAAIEICLERDGGLGEGEALLVLGDCSIPLTGLLRITDRLRRKHSGNRIHLCSIVNAKSGSCSEDCSFCAQSAHYATGVKRYPLLGVENLSMAASEAAHTGAGEFSIVTSGAAVGSEKELKVLEQTIRNIRQSSANLQSCASLGRLSTEQLERLKQAGLECFHHNLEASRRFFPRICTTHTYDDRLEMIRTAKRAGFRVCSGGIFGMGETDADRVALALELKALDVDSVPINFLHPIPGTPLEKARYLTPEICLRIIAMFRLVLPDKDIVICGGREYNLRDMQSMIFWAGANGILIGNYLTTSGRDAEADLKMLQDLGLEPYEKK